MPENTEPKPAPTKQPTDGSSGSKSTGSKEFNTRPDLDGKTDSGPEPDVHGRELPPQK